MRFPSVSPRRRYWVAVFAIALLPALGLLGRAPVPKSELLPLAMLGGGPGRNMVNLTDKGIPDKPDPTDEKLVKWKADLGSRAYGGPVIASGVVLVGTNNERPRNPRDVMKVGPFIGEPIDKGVVMCFDEAKGTFLWQAVHDKLPNRHASDWPKEGVCSTPVIEGKRAYYTSNRCTLVCLDLGGYRKGLRALVSSDDAALKGAPYDTDSDAGVVWELDMIGELGVFPHNMAACSPLLVGDIVYVITGNGVDENHTNIPSPLAPSFVAVDKKTGKVLWKRNDPGTNIMHGQWGNPSFADAGGVKQVIFPGGDGWLYACDPLTGDIVWKFDANPKGATYDLGGAGDKNDFVLAAPVIADGRLYIGMGQDPEHFTGVAHFYCLDLAKAVANAKKNADRDVSAEVVGRVEKGDDGRAKLIGTPNPHSAVVWQFGGRDDRKFVPRDFQFGRTMSSACVVDGIVYISELAGYLHCLDAKTGKHFWQYDTKGAIWGSPYYVDGKVYLATEGSDLLVFKHTKTPATIDELDNPGATDQKSYNVALKAKRKQVEAANLLAKIEFDAAIRTTPVAANGVLYVMTESTLYAFGKK